MLNQRRSKKQKKNEKQNSLDPKVDGSSAEEILNIGKSLEDLKDRHKSINQKINERFNELKENRALNENGRNNHESSISDKDLNKCQSCGFQFNKRDRSIVMLPCGDQACLECVRTKITPQDDNFYCEDCKEDIKIPSKFKKNLEVLIKQTLKFRVSCATHKGLKSHFYCNQHEKFVCTSCIKNEHVDHQQDIQILDHQQLQSINQNHIKALNDIQRKVSELLEFFQVIAQGTDSELYKDLLDESYKFLQKFLPSHQIENYHVKKIPSTKVPSTKSCETNNFIKQLSHEFEEEKVQNNDFLKAIQQDTLSKNLIPLIDYYQEQQNSLKTSQKTSPKNIIASVSSVQEQIQPKNQLKTQQSNHSEEQKSQSIYRPKQESQIDFDKILKEQSLKIAGEAPFLNQKQQEYQTFEQKTIECFKLSNQKIQYIKNQIGGLKKCNLLFRGSRDGFGAWKFHEMCDNKGKVLVLIKTNYEQVFGVFLSSLKSSGKTQTQTTDQEAFMLQITKETVHKQLQPSAKAVVNNANIFVGFAVGKTDLMIKNDCNLYVNTCTLGKNFQMPVGVKKDSVDANIYMGGAYAFLVVEIECYQV
eukprot:403365919